MCVCVCVCVSVCVCVCMYKCVHTYIIYHLSAGVFQWSQEKGVLGEDQFNLLQESKAIE